MARAIESEVIELVGATTEQWLSLFATSATTMVDKLVLCAQKKQVELTDQQLKDIETYLAAHFYSVKYPELLEEKTGRSDVKYNVKPGDGLNSSSYGRAALSLDTSGCLKNLDNTDQPKMNYIGTNECD